jgi:MYXO-CTERM domain-containing protein
MKLALPARLFGAATLALAVATIPRSAAAFPGFFASKKSEPIKTYSTQIAVMKRGADTVVSVMPDYEGPLEGFAMVLLVPADVTTDKVTTLKRDFLDRLDSLTAPRFHEYWEQDPCDPGPVEQEWERNLKVAPAMPVDSSNPAAALKPAKELFLDVKAKQKEGEYKFTLLDAGADVTAWLTKHGYKAPDGAAAALGAYGALRPLVAEVDPKRIELVGGDRAQLSPVRFATSQPFDTIPSRLGLLNAPKEQELIIYTIDPESRYEAKNYPTIFPPTNIDIDFSAKERMGEFYNALYDLILAKHPQSFLSEFAWSAEGCGQPCATEPLMISELLSLGGDFFEQSVPDAERHPKPPELTKEQDKAFKDSIKELKPKERKEREKVFKDERTTVVERQALVSRHKYVVSRLHYRYDAKTLPKDPQIGTAAAASGGTAQPKGKDGEASTEVKTGDVNKLQIRYNNFHPWVPVIQCQSPDRYRWGKAGRDYRGLRKTWITDDLTRKSHTQIKPAAVVKTLIPDLGLGAPAGAAKVDGAGGSGGSGGSGGGSGAGSKEKSGCGCHVGAKTSPVSNAALALLLAGGLGVAIRRRTAKSWRPSRRL